MAIHPQTTNSYGPVSLSVHALLARLTPGVPAVLPLLRGQRRHFERQHLGGLRLASQTVSFATSDATGMTFPVGLAARAIEALSDQDIPVVMQRNHDREGYLTIDESVLAATSGPGRAILAATVREPIGRIILRRHRQLPMFLGLLCRAYPRAQIVIATTTFADARRIARLITQSRYVGRVEVFTGESMRYPRRVTVTTYRCLRSLRGTADPKDILLVAEPATAVGRMGDTPAWESGVCAQRVYSVEVGIGQPDPYVDLVVEAIAGRILYTQVTTPQYTTIMLPPLPTSRYDATASNLRRQQARWCDRRRNIRIAAVAVAMATGDQHAFRRMGIPLTGHTCDAPRRTVLIVESIEQGRLLQRLLPGWPLLHLSDQACPALPQTPVMIITAVCARHLRPMADVVVHAGYGDPRMFARQTSPHPHLIVVGFATVRPKRRSPSGIAIRPQEVLRLPGHHLPGQAHTSHDQSGRKEAHRHTPCSVRGT